MTFQTFIAKYAQSLEGGKVVLRDVIVSKKEDKKEAGKEADKGQNYHKAAYKHKKKGKGGKKKIDVRLGHRVCGT